MSRNSTLGAVVFTVLLVTTGLSGTVGATLAGGGVTDAPSASSTDAPSASSVSQPPLAQETTTTQANQTANATANITFTDQAINNSTLVVNEANLSAGGFVVIFAQNGTVLGNTSYLEPGLHENLTVDLDTPLGRSQVVIASPHLDTNDNQTLDFNATRAAEVGVENATDRPYLQENGLPINAVAFVTVGNVTRRNTTTTESRVAPSE